MNRGKIHIVSSGINGNQTQQLSVKSNKSLMNQSAAENTRHVLRNLQVAEKLKAHNSSQRNAELGPAQAQLQTPESRIRKHTDYSLRVRVQHLVNSSQFRHTPNIMAEMTPQIKVQATNVDPSEAYRLMTGAEQPPYSHNTRPKTQGTNLSMPFAGFSNTKTGFSNQDILIENHQIDLGHSQEKIKV